MRTPRALLLSWLTPFLLWFSEGSEPSGDPWKVRCGLGWGQGQGQACRSPLQLSPTTQLSRKPEGRLGWLRAGTCVRQWWGWGPNEAPLSAHTLRRTTASGGRVARKEIHREGGPGSPVPQFPHGPSVSLAAWPLWTQGMPKMIRHQGTMASLGSSLGC